MTVTDHHAERDDYTNPDVAVTLSAMTTQEARIGLMGWGIAAGDWSWVTGHGGSVGLRAGAGTGFVPDRAGSGGSRAGLAIPPGAGRGARRGPRARRRKLGRATHDLVKRGVGRAFGALGRRFDWLVGRAGRGRCGAAGDLVAAQAGLATATLIDPESGEVVNPLGRLYGLIALAVFLALDGPLLLVRALVESYQTVPAGRMLLSSETVTTAFAQVGRVLELALRAAAPAALALALAGIAVGWLGRAAPSLPFTALALPLRSLIGIALVLLSVAALAATFAGALSALFQP